VRADARALRALVELRAPLWRRGQPDGHEDRGQGDEIAGIGRERDMGQAGQGMAEDHRAKRVKRPLQRAQAHTVRLARHRP
jgi:hypothetical protein